MENIEFLDYLTSNKFILTEIKIKVKPKSSKALASLDWKETLSEL